MSRYADASAAVGGNAGQADSRQCHAYGCPLAGAISDSLKGGGPWFCRHHHGVPPERWAEITTSLRQQQQETLL